MIENDRPPAEWRAEAIKRFDRADELFIAALNSGHLAEATRRIAHHRQMGIIAAVLSLELPNLPAEAETRPRQGCG